MLRHISLLLTCIVFYCAGYAQQNPQHLFDRANQYYHQQAYDSALSIYKQLIDEGYDNPTLYYNAGNASYQLKHSGYAVYYFSKAQQLAPANKEYEHNLHLAQSQASNKTHQIPTLFLIKWWHIFLHLFQANTWVVISIILFWLFMIFYGWNRLHDQPKSWIKRLQIPTAVLFVVTLTGTVFSFQEIQDRTSAIIVSADQTLKEAPDESSTSVKTLQWGTQVEIIDSVEDWEKIRLTDGTEGWINMSGMRTL